MEDVEQKVFFQPFDGSEGWVSLPPTQTEFEIDRPGKIVWENDGEIWVKPCIPGGCVPVTRLSNSRMSHRDMLYHRLDGPAHVASNIEHWWVEGKNITDEVNAWMTENKVPPFKDWTIAEKTLFALRFRGE